jgi:peptidoglycan hydrolase-like protein with peptidoglycan-binding domain
VYKAILAALTLLAMAWSTFAATTAKPRKHHHPATTASSRAHNSTTKATSAKATKAGTHRKGKISRRPARSYQQAPTAERYKEIQQALASKGYFQGEPTGAWGPDSADALKRFQVDQNLMPDGKVNSLSLIALGLGPKHLTAKSDSVPPPQPIARPAPTVPPPSAPTSPPQ